MKLLPKIILPLCLIGLAYFGFQKLKNSRPEPPSRVSREVIPKAEFIEVTPSEHTPGVESFGTVQAHFQTTLTPQISGLIMEVSKDFRVGKIVPRGTTLIWIDERSYKSLLIQQEANLAEAELAYAEEKIQAQQAIEDWTASGRDLKDASDFVLRKPQLKATAAMIESMKASVRKAQGDLGRTMINAPFDAIVASRTASVGNLANEQQPIGSLIAIERVEVRLPLTPSQSARIDLTQPVKVTLTSPTKPDHEWQGLVTRIEPTIGESQTMTVIVEVEKPFENEHLSIGLFVNAHLQAKPILSALKIPEAALVNDAFIWALDQDDLLVKLPAERLASESGSIFARLIEPSLEPPFRVIFRPLTNFEPGQKVDPSRP